MFVRKFVVRALLCATFVLLMGKASVATTQVTADYDDYPLTNGAILPNVLIMMDNSGSMNDAAYKLAAYSGSQPWYGYFSSNQTCMSGGPAKYAYNPATYQFELSSSGEWLGSFLNWAAMQEVDVAKKVIVGGKTYPVATITAGTHFYLNSTTGGAVANYPGRTGTGTNILIGEPSGGYSLNGTVPAATGTIPAAYTVKSLTVTIRTQVDSAPPAPLVGPLSYFTVTYKNASNISTTDPTKYYIKVKKEQSSPCDSVDFLNGDVAGVVQKTGSVVRWGLENFQGDSKFGVIVEPIVSPGYSQTFVANEEIYSPRTYTPLATSLYTALAYFSQNQLSTYNLTSRSSGTGMQYHSTDFDSTTRGGLGDPYYYSDSGQLAPCAKSFVIVITDGTANNDNLLPASVTGFDSSKGWNDSYPYGSPLDQSGAYDPMPDVALIAHTQDIRPDLTGNQNLSIYTMFVFSSESNIARATTLLKDTAQAGGFTDSNGNNIPDLVSEYTSLGRVYASSAFNPVPDNYFEATDGNLIEGQFMSAVNSLLKRAASATAVSVLSTSANGAGNVYQAFFVPSKTVNIATGSSVSTDTVAYTNTSTSATTGTTLTTSTSTSRTTGTLSSTTTGTSTATSTSMATSATTSTNTSLSTATNSSYSTSTSRTTSTTYTTSTSTSHGVRTTSTTSSTSTSTSFTTSTSSSYSTSTNTSRTTNTATSTSYSTSTSTAIATTVATSTNTGRTTSTASSYSTGTRTTSTTGTGTNTNVYTTYNSMNLVWLGDLMQLNVDANGSLRDNANNCIGFSYDAVNFVTNVNWYALGPTGVCTTSSPSNTTSLLTFTGYNWNAGPQLLTTTDSARTLFTYDVNSGTRVDFTTTNDVTLCKYMNVDAYVTCAGAHPNTDKVINWVRGQSVTGFRDRTYDAANNQYKLGDILHSTPTVVGAPQEDYNLLYQDAGYATYFNSNFTRQRVVYSGANDGMLHAFDAGSYSGGVFSNGTGNELWAYIPYNLLPHLQWLTSPSYGLAGSHIEYVDSKTKVTDVNFGTSASPNWKTVLIGGMRFGGGEINKGNDSTDASQSFRSAYFAIDVTVPTAPVVLWEVNASNWSAYSATPNALGFTMSYPAVAKVGDCFYAVVGSGPKDSYLPDYAGNSNQAGHVFVININACPATGASAGSVTGFSAPDANSYFSDPIAVDITLNANKPLVGATGSSYGTDAVYIGETYSSAYPTPNPNGAALRSKMWRLVTNNDVNPANWKFGMMYTDPAGAPISSAPAASSDPNGNIWLFWGTGRLLSPADQSDVQTQAFYGVKDPCWVTTTRAWDNTCLTASTIAPSVTSAQLANVTGAVVSTTGTLTGVAGSTTFNSLITAIKGKAGWYFNLTSLLPANPPTERAITKPTVLGGLVLFNSFIPNSSDPCSLSGSSYTYAVYYLTGTATPVSAIGTTPGGGGTTTVLARTATAVMGMASNIAIHSGQEKGAVAFIQMSTGEVITVSTTPPITQKSGVISWREL